jgi:quercetin dioxygenase-like cupin family protein
MSVADVQLVQAGIGREGSMAVKQFPLDTGVPGVQLEFSWNSYDKGYGTPRHRHTFDQYRFALDGKRMIKDGFLEPGECGFYPEGVYYGPQMQEEPTIGLGLQFQGLSGLPYLTHVDLRNARKALAAEGGTFKDGIYTKILPDGRKINKDSHAACVEYLTGQEMEFPEGRYEKPIVMKPQGHPWIGDRKLDGVEHKRLGTFGGSGIRLTRLAAGAKLPAHSQEDAEIRYLIEGSITYDGKVWQGGKTKDVGTYMFIQPGADVGEIVSPNGGTFFVIELAMLADIAAHKLPAPEVVKANTRAARVEA